MRRLLLFSSCVWLAVACGGSGEARSQSQAETPQDAVDRVVAGETPVEESSGDACALIEGAMPELFNVDLGTATVRAKEIMKNDLCRVTWPLAEGESAKRYENEVSLTVMGKTYDSPEAAVASLESAVTTLEAGVTVDVGGQERTVKSGFGDWIEDLGDRAITKKRSVLVAAKKRRFQVVVQATDDDAENQRLAIELARRVIEKL